SPAAGLRAKLATKQILTMPCCFDALSAKLVERAGFDITFMSGFSTSAAKLALPDTGLMSYGEMLDAGRDICAAVSIPVLGDAGVDPAPTPLTPQTLNGQVRGYAQAGFAAIMIEDQVAPKRCGHTKGKSVVGRDEAIGRVRAAVDARNEGADILILARTDSREGLGLEEALERIRLFAEAGADIGARGPAQGQNVGDLNVFVPGNSPHENMLEGGKKPLLPPSGRELGFGIAAYPLTLLSASISAMNTALDDLKARPPPPSRRLAHCRRVCQLWVVWICQLWAVFRQVWVVCVVIVLAHKPAHPPPQTL
ncbi:Pyruvate/Phosphoenolpyruvate kinase-like domain-containing protein, partial [Baffinella frigidus]